MSVQRDHPPPRGVTLDRTKALVDGVMAFTLTLLVVGIDVPTGDRASQPTIVAFLITIGHSVAVYGRASGSSARTGFSTARS